MLFRSALKACWASGVLDYCLERFADFAYQSNMMRYTYTDFMCQFSDLSKLFCDAVYTVYIYFLIYPCFVLCILLVYEYKYKCTQYTAMQVLFSVYNLRPILHFS